MTTKPTPAMSVEQVAERTEILRVADTPHLIDGFWHLTIAPYSVCITYRRVTADDEITWRAAVSGYRVLHNGVIDMDAQSITLQAGDDTPQWLADLIATYAPTDWQPATV